MGDLFLYAWGGDPPHWIKVKCDALGKLKIDPTGFLENTPSEDQDKKTATSEWLYDHWKNTAAHHAKYTDENARASIDDIINSNGVFVKMLQCNHQVFQYMGDMSFMATSGSTHFIKYIAPLNVPNVALQAFKFGTGYVATFLYIYNGAGWDLAAVRPWVTTAIGTHKDIANAHHDKYTDANAQAACNLDGARYWSRPGNGFIATDPQKDNYTRAITGELIADENGIDFMVAVNLPDLCTVTGCIIGGNAGLADKTWTLHRFRHSDMLQGKMATAAGNTEDTTISYSVIYNSTYGYCLHIEDLDITDEIHYARISFTITDV